MVAQESGARGGGGGNVVTRRVVRVLLFVVLLLAAMEYMFGSILEGWSKNSFYMGNVSYTSAGEQVNFLIPKRTRSQNTIKNMQREELPVPSHQILNTTAANSVPDNRTQVPSLMIDLLKNTVLTDNNLKNQSDDRSILLPASTTNLLDGKTVERDDNVNSNGGSNYIASTLSENVITSNSLVQCPSRPPDLVGPISVNKTEVELEWVEGMYPTVQKGGRHAPTECRSNSKVAIIVPFRDRKQHLAIFLRHIHPFLIKQQLDYGIFIVEQSGRPRPYVRKRASRKRRKGTRRASVFNRAKLMNVGFLEAQEHREGGWDCFIFHDIDLLPMDDQNLYSCPKQPRHMSASIDVLQFRLPYADIFGGVSALTTDQFIKVNGFSNRYWGWGGEDDDMSMRIRHEKYHISRYTMSIARYTMLDHKKDKPNPKRYQLLSQAVRNFKKDGINTLTYNLVSYTEHRLYTNILVNIDEHS